MLQVGCPYPLKHVGWIECYNPLDVRAGEQFIHSMLGDFRTQGEWYTIEPWYILGIWRRVCDLLRGAHAGLPFIPDEWLHYWYTVEELKTLANGSARHGRANMGNSWQERVDTIRMHSVIKEYVEFEKKHNLHKE